MYLLIVFLPLLGSGVAGFFGRFLGSEVMAFVVTPEFIFLLFIVLITLIFGYRILLSKKRKKSWILLLLIFFLFFLFSFLLRSCISEMICSLLGSSLICWFSSDSSGGENSLPPLESSSSSESLNTFRQLYAADYEGEIYNRIRTLENGNYYRIPPQTRPGEYESIVRQHFDQAITVDHLRSAMDMEYNEVKIWEKKALLQDRLFSFLISESRIDRIMELSPFDNIRKEAFEFIDGEVEDLNELRSSLQRSQMDERLSSFLTSIRDHGRASPTYRGFYSHFTNETFRRLHGLPLP
jgi:uncharacterized membrane protein YhaH (DUF805 family)